MSATGEAVSSAGRGNRWVRLERPAFAAQIMAADGSRAVKVGISGKVVGAGARPCPCPGPAPLYDPSMPPARPGP